MSWWSESGVFKVTWKTCSVGGPPGTWLGTTVLDFSALAYQTCSAWTPAGRRSSSLVWSHTPAYRCGKACTGRSDTRDTRPERRDMDSTMRRKPPRDSRRSDWPLNNQPCKYSRLLVQTSSFCHYLWHIFMLKFTWWTAGRPRLGCSLGH